MILSKCISRTFKITNKRTISFDNYQREYEDKSKFIDRISTVIDEIINKGGTIVSTSFINENEAVIFYNDNKSIEKFGKNKIITLCGSTKFEENFKETKKKLEDLGIKVLQPEIFSKTNDIIISDDVMKQLIEIHKYKIYISDAIYVINPDNYIGEHTKLEIDYAISLGKDIYYLNQ